MKKRLVVLLAGLLTVLSMGFGLAQFSDVPAGHWAKEAVESLAAKGIIVGFPDGTYRGNETLTRYQAALIIYRLLQQIEEELKAKGESPTMEAMSSEDLEALKNAVQELAAELAALGVRVSALEDSAATKEDIARLEALIEELKAQPASEPGMDAAALQDLADRVEAASIAADTALAQAQQLAEQLDALAQDVEGVKGDLSALGTQVEANAQAIQALNELAVLLNQDVLALQDRVTALEKMVSGGAELPDLEQFASKEDVAAVQEFAAALRSDLVGLSEKVSKLESQVAELSKVRYSISGSLTATAGLRYFTQGSTAFDWDRLFPGSVFSTGQTGTASYAASRVGLAEGAGNLFRGDATLTLGVKNNAPAASGVAVAEASATFGVRVYDTSLVSTPTVRLDGVAIKGQVDGQPFSVTYSRVASKFKFNDYLLANDAEGGVAHYRQGVVATFSGTNLPFSPEVTLVGGVAGPGSPADAAPAINGNYFGIRTVLKPLQGASLGLNYALNVGIRSAIGADASLELGPAKLSGLWVSSKTLGLGEPFTAYFDRNRSSWAYYGEAEVNLGSVNLSANYRAVDTEYADGQASMSENEDANYYGENISTVPYGYNTRGFGVEAKASVGPVGVEAYLDSKRGYNDAANSANNDIAFGLAAEVSLFRGFSLTGYFNRACDNATSPTAFGCTGGTQRDFLNSGSDYFLNNPTQRYSSSFGARLEHQADAEDALIKGLSVVAQYTRFTVSNHNDFQVAAFFAQPMALGPIKAQPGVRFHYFDDGTGGGNADYSALKAGVRLSTDPLALPFKPSLSADAAYRSTRFGGGARAGEVYGRAGLTLNELFAPGLSFTVAGAIYGAWNVAQGAGGLITVGAGENAFSYDRDRLFASPGGTGAPTASFGSNSGSVEGLYGELKYYDLSVAGGYFRLRQGQANSPFGGTVDTVAKAFRVSYTVKF
ncbi:S-layer homology domain-containing protein [Thermus brockianus]|uniref:S-layer P100 protein n=1 Tax=Thermus brockianus TaxID=56956 RepID=A0A1J0LS20_THEBO|nr:S-layer homology domain-containing protein [Thermus brockianus]APD09110.1 S-layer P100 protein [Thermus brockianus]